MESEYHALSTTTCELVWITYLLNDLHNQNTDEETTKPILYTDSSSAEAIAKNPIAHQKTKPIEIDAYFMRDRVISGYLDLQHINTKVNVADLCIKALGGSTFQYR